MVNNSLLCFEIDTGSSVMISSLNDAKKHFAKFTVLQTPIDCVGYIMVNVATPDPSQPVKFHVVRSERKPLLGRE